MNRDNLNDYCHKYVILLRALKNGGTSMEAFSILIILAIAVTIMEVFVAIFLVKKHGMSVWRTLYTSVPVVVIVWVVAFIYT